MIHCEGIHVYTYVLYTCKDKEQISLAQSMYNYVVHKFNISAVCGLDSPYIILYFVRASLYNIHLFYSLSVPKTGT